MEVCMDKTTLISMAVFIFTNIGTIISMFLWVRSEANLDRRESLDLLRAIQADSKAFQNAMMTEAKDFHGRLCAIEERNKK